MYLRTDNSDENMAIFQFLTNLPILIFKNGTRLDYSYFCRNGIFSTVTDTNISQKNESLQMPAA